MAIIANERGALEASQFDEISYLGYPFSISETFQLRNTNATIAESLERVKAIQEITQKADKQLVIYISMGFGNPYGDIWNAGIALHWVEELQKLGIKIYLPVFALITAPNFSISSNVLGGALSGNPAF